MDINNEELKKDLEEQYAMLEEEIQEDKKKKRYLLIFVFFLVIFLIIFGTTFSYYKLYEGSSIKEEESIIKDLYIEGYEDAFEFDSKIYTYVLSVPNNTISIKLKYLLENTNYSVEIKGNEDLKPGVNTVEVIIRNQDGDEVKKYVIYVTVEDDSDNPQTPSTGMPEEIKKDLSLKNISVTNHTFAENFNSNKTNYIIDDIKDSEDNILVNFELSDNSNEIVLKLNDAVITRKPTGKYSINLNIDTELNLGTNKLEIIVKDSDGNENIYYIFLVVNKSEEEQKVIEISVEYGNANGSYIIGNIIPGWQSTERQHIIVTNNSNYDTNIDINWTEVSNNFVNTTDLEYFLYKDNSLLKTGVLPVKDELLMENLKVPANSKNNYYISYRYIYSEKDQNIDQGKTFNTKLKVTLSK